MKRNTAGEQGDGRAYAGGMLWAQPVTELLMMAASVWLLTRTIRAEEMRWEARKEGD